MDGRSSSCGCDRRRSSTGGAARARPSRADARRGHARSRVRVRTGLPASDDGPSRDNIQRDRYRVLWDVTIDGRLARAGRGPRDAHARELVGRNSPPRSRCLVTIVGAPSMSGSNGPSDARRAGGVRPGAGRGRHRAGDSGRCPLCRFPVAALDPRPDRLSAAVAGDSRPSSVVGYRAGVVPAMSGSL